MVTGAQMLVFLLATVVGSADAQTSTAFSDTTVWTPLYAQDNHLYLNMGSVHRTTIDNGHRIASGWFGQDWEPRMAAQVSVRFDHLKLQIQADCTEGTIIHLQTIAYNTHAAPYKSWGTDKPTAPVPGSFGYDEMRLLCAGSPR
jgi:hypothetical protein